MIRFNKILSVYILLVCSLLVVVLGGVLGLYVGLTGYYGPWSWLAGFVLVLGGVTLGIFIRVVANIGQMAFELNQKALEQQNIQISLLGVLQDFIAQHKNSQTSLTSILQELSNLKRLLDVSLEQKNIISDVYTQQKNIQEHLAIISARMKDLASSSELMDHLAVISARMKDLVASSAQMGQLKGLVEISSMQKELLTDSNHRQDRMRAHLEVLVKEMEQLKNAVECANCDSKDINESMHKIRVFFEKISNHLHL